MGNVRISSEALEKLVTDILVSSDVDAYEAKIVATVLVWNELVGRSTQGVIRLPIYLKRLRQGLIQSPCDPELEQKSDTICMIKGNDGFGQLLGHQAMSRAIDLAAKHGVGIVGVSGSTHFGSCAYYLQLAAQANQLSLVTTNSVPKVAAHGGITAVFGTNPMGFGAPTKGGESILMDLSTGSLAGSTVRKAIANNELLSDGAVIDENGDFIRDPKLASQGVMLPFGGAKGYCLGLMVEILSGIMTGAAISQEVGSLYHDFDRSHNSGHFFLTLDISRMLPLDIYFDRMETLINFIKASKKRAEFDEILLPGQSRWCHYNHQLNAGIELSPESIEALELVANGSNLSVPW